MLQRRYRKLHCLGQAEKSEKKKVTTLSCCPSNPSLPGVTHLHQPDGREEGQAWRQKGGTEAACVPFRACWMYLASSAPRCALDSSSTLGTALSCPPGRLLLLLRPRARVRVRHRLCQGARRQDRHQQAQAPRPRSWPREQRAWTGTKSAGHPRALEEGRTPKVQRRGLSPKARGSGSARQVPALGSRCDLSGCVQAAPRSSLG